MTKEKLPTIQLQGKEYTLVQDRVSSFNKDNPNGSIETSVEPQDDAGYIFTAKVTPDTTKPERFFSGHSYGKLSKEKAMEKLETVAVGRALAFMGIGIVEGIASADEIKNWQDKQTPASKYVPKKPTSWKHVAGCGGDLVQEGKKYVCTNKDCVGF